MRRLLPIIALALAGCQQLPLTPADIEARKFEPVPDKAAIYVVRPVADFSSMETIVVLGDIQVSTDRGTYYRWVVPPGKHLINGWGPDSGRLILYVERGKIYFVVQSVTGMRSPQSFFYVVTEAEGRAAVLRSVLLTPRKALQ